MVGCQEVEQSVCCGGGLGDVSFHTALKIHTYHAGCHNVTLYICVLNIFICIFFCFTIFRTALFGRFRSWLSEVLGVELEPTVDISCARYEHTGGQGEVKYS